MIIPTKDYIILSVEKKAEEKTSSGIYLPEKIADTPQCGTVVAINSGWHFANESVVDQLKKGTKVFFKMWAGTPINYEGTDYLLVHVKDVIAFEGGES